MRAFVSSEVAHCMRVRGWGRGTAAFNNADASSHALLGSFLAIPIVNILVFGFPRSFENSCKRACILISVAPIPSCVFFWQSRNGEYSLRA